MKEPDGKYITYLGKLEGFEKKGGRVFVRINLGSVTSRLQVGEFGVDSVGIIEKRVSNYSSFGELKPNYTALTDYGLNQLAKKYKDKYIEFSVRTALWADEASKLSNLLSTKTDEESKKTLKDEIVYWQNCVAYLDSFLSSLNQVGLLGSVKYTTKYLLDKYNKCLPYVRTYDILL